LPLDPTTVRVSIFRNIDLLLASGDSDDLEKAAELLAELDATAFSLLDADTRVRYSTALVKAWTNEPQEKAIVEISRASPTETNWKPSSSSSRMPASGINCLTISIANCGRC